VGGIRRNISIPLFSKAEVPVFVLYNNFPWVILRQPVLTVWSGRVDLGIVPDLLRLLSLSGHLKGPQSLRRSEQ
jgi:hypothetical protein